VKAGLKLEGHGAATGIVECLPRALVIVEVQRKVGRDVLALSGTRQGSIDEKPVIKVICMHRERLTSQVEDNQKTVND